MSSAIFVAIAVAAVTAQEAHTGDTNWTIANLSNVYADAYENPMVTFAGKTESAEACQRLCGVTTSCNSYTWTPGPQKSDDKCKYTHDCYVRSDKVWVLKSTANCKGISGYKGIPIPGPSPSPGPAPPSPPSPPSPPAPKGALNVLFIIFDDLRIMHDAYGFSPESGANMPHTEALAKRSTVFHNAYCQQAVCGPSRASLLSGRRPDTTQMWNFKGGFRQTPGADKWNTWPEWFLKHGYYTAGSGKLFHPGDPVDFDPQSWTGNAYGGYYGQDHCPIDPAKLNNSHGCPIPASMNHTYPDLETLATAKSQLAIAANQSKPFWIGAGFVKPHMPHVFPEEYLDKVPPASDIQLAKHMTPPTGIAAALEWTSGAEGPQTKNSEINTPASNATQVNWRQSYYAAAAFSDNVLGQLLAELDVYGFTDNTIIIMTADHGWGLGEHNHWVKYTNWETDARIPLIIHHPTATHTWGTYTSSLVEHVDLYPTISELAGVPVLPNAHESIEGFSYAKLFSSSESPNATIWTSPYNASFTQYPRCGETINPDGTPNLSTGKRCASVAKTAFKYMGYSMRTTQYRYTEFAQWNGSTLKPKWADDVHGPNALVELYDHLEDVPGIGQSMWDDFENENIASANPDLVTKFSAQLRAFYAAYDSQRNAPYGVATN